MDRRVLCATGFMLLAAAGGWGRAESERVGFPGSFAVTGFGPAQWGSSDAALGLSPEHVIEDFEDVALIPGLRIAVVTTLSGAYGPTDTLPATFNPVTQDGFGDLFDEGVWDGARVLVNTGDNQSHTYTVAGFWGDVQLLFSTPVAEVAFSVEQMNISATVSVNGFPLGSLLNLAGLPAGGGRNGYVVIRSPNPASMPITFVELNNAAGDGFVIDHLAARFVYCPGDTDGDGFVLFNDLNVVVSAFNTAAGEAGYNDAADFDDDGVVDFDDLNETLSRFNDPCTGG